MSNLPHVHNVLFGEPWMIAEAWHNTLAEIYTNKIDGLNTPEKIEAAITAAGGQQPPKDPNRKPYEVRGDVAVIALEGPLIPKGGLFTKISGLTSMAEFRSTFSMAVTDEAVSSIVLHIDSPGGSVIGAFETAAMVLEARNGAKPVVSMIDGIGASCAYLIASQAVEVFASEASVVGSIGVIARLDSIERMKRNAGVDPVVIRSSELKAIGAGDITPNQMGELQKRVAEYFAMFKNAVSIARPNLDVESVATGQTWIGKKSVEVGLVDGITTLEKLIASLS